MVGPGLVFVLALALALPAAAERAVGLDAQGVDPMAALHNARGLDVRDQYGRPVSARLIEAELKQANTQAAVEAAYASTLPRAAEMAAVLAMLEALRLAIRTAASSLPERLLALLPAARPNTKSPVRAVALLGIVLLSAACWRRHALSSALVRCSAPAVLRC